MNNKGISLIELVTSVAILSVSTLMVISCFYGIASIKGKTTQYSNMELVCENIFEEMRVTGKYSVYDDVLNGVTFNLETNENGQCEITFYTKNSAEIKTYYFWINPEVLVHES
ncbi:MAG: hypothetical protein R3Y12_04060 [Clostridia bacterium]